MKNILIATDFSPNAINAGKYGYALASHLQANVILVNSFLALEPTPQGNMAGWPADDYPVLLEDSQHQLQLCKHELENHAAVNTFRPAITCVSEMGSVAEVLTEICGRQDIGMIVLGSHYNDTFKTIIEGNHCRRLIDTTTKPLLIVPAEAQYVPIKKIAFATDFNHMEDDLHAIYQLIDMGRELHADILLSHINTKTSWNDSNLGHMKQMLADLSNKANYPHIYYRIIKQKDIETGLEWLCEHSRVDVLAMVHHHHSLLSKIFAGSHTQKMAAHTKLPLLVIPPKD